MKLKFTKSKMRAFSLVELIVSISIVGLIIIMLNNIILTTALVSQKSLARSFVREELSNIADLVASDIRSADRVGNCAGSMLSGDLRCEIYGLQTVVWQICNVDGEDFICRTDVQGTPIFMSAKDVNIQSASFELGFGDGTAPTRRSILFTIVAGHDNEKLDVTNIVRQIIISTRNYVLM
jgi:type II secretory pathway pseudopilin PulG